MLTEILKWVFSIVGIRGMSATVLLILLLVLAYGNTAVSAGATVSRGVSYLRFTAAVIIAGLLSGVLMLDPEQLQDLLRLVSSIDWTALWREVTEYVRR